MNPASRTALHFEPQPCTPDADTLFCDGRLLKPKEIISPQGGARCGLRHSPLLDAGTASRALLEATVVAILHIACAAMSADRAFPAVSLCRSQQDTASLPLTKAPHKTAADDEDIHHIDPCFADVAPTHMLARALLGLFLRFLAKFAKEKVRVQNGSIWGHTRRPVQRLYATSA